MPANVTATSFTLLGGQLQIGDGATPENFTTISQVQTCDFGGEKVEVDTVTSADNTDGVIRKQDRLLDEGQCSGEIIWNPNDASHQQFWTAWRARGKHNFKRINPGGFGTRSFTGIIVGASLKQTLNKATMCAYKIDISDPVTSTVPGA
jgi:hypothetical protein